MDPIGERLEDQLFGDLDSPTVGNVCKVLGLCQRLEPSLPRRRQPQRREQQHEKSVCNRGGELELELGAFRSKDGQRHSAVASAIP